jgi:acetolactate synthase-1/3 small subunit
MRVVSLFSRRGYNIDSLSVGETETRKSAESPSWSAATAGRREIKKQVGKLIDVKRCMK